MMNISRILNIIRDKEALIVPIQEYYLITCPCQLEYTIQSALKRCYQFIEVNVWKRLKIKNNWIPIKYFTSN